MHNSWITMEELESFPIQHISPSSIRSFLEDRGGFFKKYVLGIWDDITSGPSSVVGSIVHSYIEYMNTGCASLTEFDQEAFDSVFRDIMPKYYTEGDDIQDGQTLLRMGKTGSWTKIEASAKAAIENYIQYFIAYDIQSYKVISAEKKMKMEVVDPTNGSVLPIQIKGVIDCVMEKEDGSISIIDYKTKKSPQKTNKMRPEYIIQACSYALLVFADAGKKVSEVVFLEIPTTRKSCTLRVDQLKKILEANDIPIEKGSRKADLENSARSMGLIPEKPHGVIENKVVIDSNTMGVFMNIYKYMIIDIAGRVPIDEAGNRVFLPNPYTSFGGRESWDFFVEQCMPEYKEEAGERQMSVDVGGVADLLGF